jgi:hypothetical protein
MLPTAATLKAALKSKVQPQFAIPIPDQSAT